MRLRPCRVREAQVPTRRRTLTRSNPIEYTALPYSFDLLYDIKSVEELHAHLTGERRTATSATDAELVELMREHSIPFPPGYKMPDAPLQERYDALLEVVRDLHLHAKRSPGDTSSVMDGHWVLNRTGEALAKQPGLTDEERIAFLHPSPFL